MGVTVKHLKLLEDGRWQYRRVWPQDVRKAVPDLTSEVKKKFDEGTTKAAALRWSLDQDQKADALIAKVRSGAADIEREEQTTETVIRWFNQNRDEWDKAITTSWAQDRFGTPIEVETTQRDYERDLILDAAMKREGTAPDGNPKQLTLEEDLKLTALKTNEPPSIRMTLSRAFDFYVERHLGNREDKATETARQQALDHFGDIPLDRITRAMASDWAHYLAKSRSQGAATIKKRIGSLKAVINFAKDQGRYTGDNEFARLQPPKHAKAPEDRLPFHTSHLAAIGRHLEAPRVRQETKDLVWLLQLTGCRPSEIGGLKAEDLNLTANIPYAYVRWTPDKRTKTVQSKRRVPLLGPALEAARRAKKRHPSGWLFPTLAPKSGEANDNPRMSARINKTIRASGIHKTGRLVAYSFRHTMAEALDRAGVGQVVRDRVLGKQKADRYGANELPLEDALAAMEAALPLLGNIDAIEYSAEELKITVKDDG
jgi:integrase